MLRKLEAPQISRPIGGLLFMGVAVVLWAAAEALVGRLPKGVSVPVIVAVRYTTHLAALILLTLRQGSALYTTRRPALQIGRGLLMLGMPLCSVVAVAQAPAAVVWAIFWVTPLLVVGLARLITGERIPRWAWVTALISCIGVLLVIRPVPVGLAAALAPALGMALCFSLYLVVTRMLCNEATSTSLFYTGASVLLPLILAAPFYWRTPPAEAWPTLIGIGLVGLVALYAFDRALHLAPPAAMAPILCLQPLLLVGFADLSTGVWPGRMALLGAVMVLGAIMLAFYRHTRIDVMRAGT